MRVTAQNGCSAAVGGWIWTPAKFVVGASQTTNQPATGIVLGGSEKDRALRVAWDLGGGGKNLLKTWTPQNRSRIGSKPRGLVFGQLGSVTSM